LNVHPSSASRLSAARRRTALAIRWLSIPLAAVVVIAPLWSLRWEYQRSADLIPTTATVLDARVTNAARVSSEWEIYARYPVRGKPVENSVRVWSNFDLDKGDTITLLVDPATGDAEYDARGMAWLIAAFGAILAAFFVLAGFRAMGAMLRRDRRLREGGSA
jgi:hypothetical protein